jgi:hypothetical protein
VARQWTCPHCKWKQPHRTSSRTCAKCGETTKPKRRVRKVDVTLRDDSYQAYVRVAAEIHGIIDESCCACGKPRTLERRCDRDHDHTTGKPRGLLCGGNQGCNVLLAKWVTPAVAEAIAETKHRAGESDAERWSMLASYLRRVESHYAGTEAVNG